MSDAEDKKDYKIVIPALQDLTFSPEQVAKRRGPKPGVASKLKAIRDHLAETGMIEKLADKMYAIAMTDGHPLQGVMLAKFADKVFPTSGFDEAGAAKTGNTVNVIIPGASQGPIPIIKVVGPKDVD
jgi:hypothetical protein